MESSQRQTQCRDPVVLVFLSKIYAMTSDPSPHRSVHKISIEEENTTYPFLEAFCKGNYKDPKLQNQRESLMGRQANKGPIEKQRNIDDLECSF